MYELKEFQDGADNYYVILKDGEELSGEEVMNKLKILNDSHIPEDATHYQTGVGSYMEGYLKDLTEADEHGVGECCFWVDGEWVEDGGYEKKHVTKL